MTSEQPIRQQTSFQDMDLPQTVYKYRVWKNPRHQTILTDRQVWFAQPSSFEDPLDCKIPIRYDLLTEKDIYPKVANKNLTRKFILKMLENYFFASFFVDQ